MTIRTILITLTLTAPSHGADGDILLDYRTATGITRRAIAPGASTDVLALNGSGIVAKLPRTTFGSVSSASVISANGISGSVATPTTTPAITLALGAITPTSVFASRSDSATAISAVNSASARAGFVLSTPFGDAATDVLTAAGHTLQNGDAVYFTALTGGAGIALSYFTTGLVPYYAFNVTANTFQLAATIGGSAVNFTTNISAGTIASTAPSPSITLVGQGRKTNATAASQTVRHQIYLVPVQGAANPTSEFRLDYDHGLGSYSSGLRYIPGSTGILYLTSTGASANGSVSIRAGTTYNDAFLDFGAYALNFGNTLLAATQYSVNPGLTLGSDNGSYCIAISTAPSAVARTNANSNTWSRESQGVWQAGMDHATATQDSVIKSMDVTTGTGGAITIRGGNGSAAGGAVIISTSATTTPVARLAVKASGVVNIANIPTSSVGLVSGDLWSSAGVIMIVP